MGLTPLAGLPMGTRSGDMDAGVIEFIANKYGMTSSASAVNMLNKKSGVLGISGVSSDFRDLEGAAEKGNKRAALAIEVFEYRVRKMIGEYAAAMGGVDAVIFTAGVGENSPRSCARSSSRVWSSWASPSIAEKNKVRGEERIVSKDGAPVKVLVIPTNEELMIAMDTMEIVKG